MGCLWFSWDVNKTGFAPMSLPGGITLHPGVYPLPRSLIRSSDYLGVLRQVRQFKSSNFFSSPHLRFESIVPRQLRRREIPRSFNVTYSDLIRWHKPFVSFHVLSLNLNFTLCPASFVSTIILNNPSYFAYSLVQFLGLEIHIHFLLQLWHDWIKVTFERQKHILKV